MLHDPLATQLESEAHQKQVSVQELAGDLLTRALEGTKDATWHKTNQRRLALVRKSATLGLTPQEAGELQQLQILADRRLEAMDAERLAEVKRMEETVKAALQEAGES
jgi:hypothetical protein